MWCIFKEIHEQSLTLSSVISLVRLLLQKEICSRKGETFSCLIKHNAMKTYGGVEVQLHAFLTCALAAVMHIKVNRQASKEHIKKTYVLSWSTVFRSCFHMHYNKNRSNRLTKKKHPLDTRWHSLISCRWSSNSGAS
jgi:hypothetical protein